MLLTLVQLEKHDGLSHQFLVETETLLQRFLWCPRIFIMAKHWDAFCRGEKKPQNYCPPSKPSQNRYLPVFFIVISSAELVLLGQMRLCSTGVDCIHGDVPSDWDLPSRTLSYQSSSFVILSIFSLSIILVGFGLVFWFLFSIFLLFFLRLTLIPEST